MRDWMKRKGFGRHPEFEGKSADELLFLTEAELERVAPGEGERLYEELHPTLDDEADWNRVRDWLKKKGFGKNVRDFEVCVVIVSLM